MYSPEEFDKAKTKVLKYVLYKKRSENEIRSKFSSVIEEDLLSDVIEYLKEAQYIDDNIYIEKTVNNFMLLKNLSIKEIKYKLLAKGIDKYKIDDYIDTRREELENYELKSIQNIFYKKSASMNEDEIKAFLLKKGYKVDNINKVIEENS